MLATRKRVKRKKPNSSLEVRRRSLPDNPTVRLIARRARQAKLEIIPAYSPTPRHSIESVKCEEMVMIGDDRYAVHEIKNERCETTLTRAPLLRVAGAIYVVKRGRRKRVLVIPRDDLLQAYFPQNRGPGRRFMSFLRSNAPLDLDYYEERWVKG